MSLVRSSAILSNIAGIFSSSIPLLYVNRTQRFTRIGSVA